MLLRSLARRLGHQPWLARLAPVIVPADRFVARLTRGRLVVFGAVPSLLLTTTGRRSGQLRTTPLACVPDGDAVLVIGSNWGRPRHPAWALNLLAHPEATITRTGKRFLVRARGLVGPERNRAWQLALHQWPPYQSYAERSGRELHVFRLEPVARGTGPPETSDTSIGPTAARAKIVSTAATTEPPQIPTEPTPGMPCTGHTRMRRG